MKDIRILEEAIGKATDEAGKLALIDLISDNLTEFSVLAPAAGGEDASVPGLPVFTREEFMEGLPRVEVRKVTLQEAFEEAMCLPGCGGVVLNVTHQPAPAISIGGIHTRLVRWDRREEDPPEVYEGLDKRMLIMRLLLTLKGERRDEIMRAIQKLHLLCARVPAREAEACLDELVVFLEAPERRWEEAQQKLNAVLARNGIREEDVLLAYGGEEALQRMLEEKNDAGAVGWAYVHRTEVSAAPQAAAALQAGRKSGIPGAAALLGCFYETGWGVEKDLKRARACFAGDAAAGNAQAIRRFAKLLERGMEGSAPDPEQALSFYQRGAELSADPGCLTALGDAAFFGEIPLFGEEDAFGLYRRALARTYEAPGTEECRPGALLRVGLCLLYGLGTPKSPERALGYLRQAVGLYVSSCSWDPSAEEKAFWAGLLCDEARNAIHPEGRQLQKGDWIQFEEDDGTLSGGVILEIVEEERLYRIRKKGKDKSCCIRDGSIRDAGGDRFRSYSSLLRLPLLGLLEAEGEIGITADLYGAFACAEGLLAGRGRDPKAIREALYSHRTVWEKRHGGLPGRVLPAALAAPCGMLAASPEEAAALAGQAAAAWDMDGSSRQRAELFAVYIQLAGQGLGEEEIRSALAERFPGALEEEEHPEVLAILAALSAGSFLSAVVTAEEWDCDPGAAGLAAGALFPVPEETAYHGLLCVTDDVRQVLRHMQRALSEREQNKRERGQ